VSIAPASSGSALQPRGPDAVAKEQPNKVVATVNGKQITAKEADEMINSLPPQDRVRYQSNLAMLVQQMYTEDQIAALALQQNLDQKSPWKQQLQLTRDNVLAKAYITNLLESPTAAANAKTYYDSHTAEFDQVKVSGIMVSYNNPGTPATGNTLPVTRTEADAKTKAEDLEKKIKAGGDFSALARTDSDLQQSSAKGGDMGNFVMADTNIPAEIRDAVAKLQPGQISDPLKASLGGMNGYLILKLDSRTRLPFNDQVKNSIIQKAELDKYKIHVEDPDFFSAAPPPAPANIPSLARPNGPANPTPSAPATPVKPPAR
jgi:hypothetical protein